MSPHNRWIPIGLLTVALVGSACSSDPEPGIECSNLRDRDWSGDLRTDVIGIWRCAYDENSAPFCRVLPDGTIDLFTPGYLYVTGAGTWSVDDDELLVLDVEESAFFESGDHAVLRLRENGRWAMGLEFEIVSEENEFFGQSWFSWQCTFPRADDRE